MDVAPLHDRLGSIVPALLADEGDPDLAEAEAHAAAGCSRCARALCNAREAAAELGAAPAPVAPSPSQRTAVLADAHAAVSRRAGAPVPHFHDPSEEVARRHVEAPDDAARVAEIDALDALTPSPDGCERLLAELERESGFPLLLVTIVRGPRVGYRVQRGLPPDPAAPRDRRREASFCTHVVAGDAPLVVPDAAAEPFFRGSSMVREAGVGAYVGVPLTTPRGVTIGTVCAMDFRPRAIDAGLVSLLQRHAARIAAEIELGRR